MLSLMAMFIIWLVANQCDWVLEQPTSSIMCLHPRMEQVRRLVGSAWTEVSTCMGAFGAPTTKPSTLYSSSEWVRALARSLSLEERSQLAGGKEVVTQDPITGQITGGRDLKKTQEYPAGYGDAVSSAFEQRVVDVDSEDDDGDDDDLQDLARDDWEDAGLKGVCAWLRLPHDRMVV